MPRHFLDEVAGIHPERDFSSVTYAGSHDTTVEAVRSGKVDAGAVNTRIWEQLVESDGPGELVAFWTSPEYFDYTWAARGDAIPSDLLELIIQTLLELRPEDPHAASLLASQGASRYVRARPESYDRLESVARRLNMIYRPWPWMNDEQRP